MDTKNALLLLAKVSGNNEKVLEIAKSYVADGIKLYHEGEKCVLFKDGKVQPFIRSEEFASLRKSIAKIESATTVIDEFFMIDEDIARLKQYSEMGMFIPMAMDFGTVEPEPEPEPVKEVKPAKKAKAAKEPEPAKESEPVKEPEPAKEPEPKEEKPKSKSKPALNVPSFGNMGAKPEPKEEPKPEPEEEPEIEVEQEEIEQAEEAAPEPEEEKEFVGITKIETEDSVKAMVGYAEGDNYENPYETVYEDDILPQDAMSMTEKLFDGPAKTEPDDIIAEAKMVMERGGNFIYTGSNPSTYLNKRMEYMRIKYALKNIEDGAGSDESEIDVISDALKTIRGYEARNSLLSIELVDYDMAQVEKVYGLLKEFDSKLYPPEALPDIERIKELMNSSSDYDEKASLLTRFYKFDVIKFLKTVYTSCKNLELDKNKRLNVEMKKLEDEYFAEQLEIQKESYNAKKGLFGGGNKKTIDSKKKAIEDKHKRDVEELQSRIGEIVESDTKMVGKNMKLYARIDNLLKNNILCFKTK